MYRATVVCQGLSDGEARDAVADMLSEFAHRPWQKSVTCEWRDGILRLAAENEVDESGLALLDEFGDAIAAYVSHAGEVRLEVESVVKVDAPHEL